MRLSNNGGVARCRCDGCQTTPECPPTALTLPLPLSKPFGVTVTGAPELTATVKTRTSPCGCPFGLDQTAIITVPSGGSREATLVAAAYAVMVDFQKFVPSVVCCGGGASAADATRV